MCVGLCMWTEMYLLANCDVGVAVLPISTLSIGKCLLAIEKL